MKFKIQIHEHGMYLPFFKIWPTSSTFKPLLHSNRIVGLIGFPSSVVAISEQVQPPISTKEAGFWSLASKKLQCKHSTPLKHQWNPPKTYIKHTVSPNVKYVANLLSVTLTSPWNMVLCRTCRPSITTIGRGQGWCGGEEIRQIRGQGPDDDSNEVLRDGSGSYRSCLVSILGSMIWG